jgi:hypothetical protein
VTRRLFLVGTLRGKAGTCEPCRRDDHDHCEPVAIAVDELGVGVQSAGYVECRCLCMPEWMRTALDNGWVPPQRAGEGNRRPTVYELAEPAEPRRFYDGVAVLEPIDRRHK